MSILLLPDELLSYILTHWLDQNQVARLDSAMCSSQHREGFLDLLRNKCIFQTMLVDQMSVLNYIISRQLRSNDIRIDIKSNERFLGYPDRISAWVHNISKTLHRLTLRHIPEQLTESFVQSAYHVDVLKLESCELSNTVVTILEQRPVSEIILVGCRTIGCEFRVNSEIQKLSMCYIYGQSYTCGFRISLPDQLNHLRSLELKGEWVTDELLILFSLHCPNVMHLNVCTDITTESAMITIMQNFHNLQSLEIIIDVNSTNHLLGVIAERHGHSLYRLSVDINTLTLTLDLHRLLSACLHLHILYLSSPISNGIAAVLSQQNLTLTSLFIYADLDKPSLQAIADYCKHIRVVGLESWDRMDERDVHILLSECKMLQNAYIDSPTSGYEDSPTLGYEDSPTSGYEDSPTLGYEDSPTSGYEDSHTVVIMEMLRNSWPKVQFTHGDFPAFNVMTNQ